MMKDIVERLRDRANWRTCVPAEKIMAEAADKIEELREEIAWLSDTLVAAAVGRD
jgi:ferritin-like metal-binding protein YciE